MKNLKLKHRILTILIVFTLYFNFNLQSTNAWDPDFQGQMKIGTEFLYNVWVFNEPLIIQLYGDDWKNKTDITHIPIGAYSHGAKSKDIITDVYFNVINGTERFFIALNRWDWINSSQQFSEYPDYVNITYYAFKTPAEYSNIYTSGVNEPLKFILYPWPHYLSRITFAENWYGAHHGNYNFGIIGYREYLPEGCPKVWKLWFYHGTYGFPSFYGIEYTTICYGENPEFPGVIEWRAEYIYGIHITPVEDLTTDPPFFEGLEMYFTLGLVGIASVLVLMVRKKK